MIGYLDEPAMFRAKSHRWLTVRGQAARLRARVAAMPPAEAARLWRKLLAGLV